MCTRVLEKQSLEFTKKISNRLTIPSIKGLQHNQQQLRNMTEEYPNHLTSGNNINENKWEFRSVIPVWKSYTLWTYLWYTHCEHNTISNHTHTYTEIGDLKPENIPKPMCKSENDTYIRWNRERRGSEFV